MSLMLQTGSFGLLDKLSVSARLGYLKEGQKILKMIDATVS